MARQDFANVVHKMANDPAFAARVKADPQSELSGISLTSAELKALKEMAPEHLDTVVRGLASRAMEGTNGCTGGTNGCVGETARTTAVREEQPAILPIGGTPTPNP